MRICLFANNKVGWKVAEFLRQQGEDIVALVVHPPARRKFGDEIIAAAGADESCVFDGSTLQESATIDAVRKLDPQIGISAFFGYILQSQWLEMFPCVNIHSGLLPYNRGVFTNVWSIIDRTPSGVSIHDMDEGVDTGDIISQCKVPIEPIDTGETLYQRLEEAAVILFKSTWPMIRNGEAPRIAQNPNEGTTHRIADVERIDRIDLDRKYTARELIDIIRARTFAGYRGAYFMYEGRRIHLSLQLTEEENRVG